MHLPSEAIRLVLDISHRTAAQQRAQNVPLEFANHLCISEAVIADKPYPPFDRVCMDGIALCFPIQNSIDNFFPSEGICSAGSPPASLNKNNSCIEVMTGSVLPTNTNTVIPYEEIISHENGFIVKELSKHKQGQHIHRKGTDFSEGQLLIPAGKRLSFPDLTLLATVGKHNVLVNTQPKISILATGSELCEIAQTPLPHQIRQSNSLTLAALLKDHGFDSHSSFLPDDLQKLTDHIQTELNSNQVLWISGGVSKGKYDYIPELLKKLGVNIYVHGVSQKPGKPFLFGEYKNQAHTCLVFGLPGNPVSAVFNARIYGLPSLYLLAGFGDLQPVGAKLANDISSKTKFNMYIPVSFKIADGQLLVATQITKGSGDFTSLQNTHGLIELPSGPCALTSGSLVQFFPWVPLC